MLQAAKSKPALHGKGSISPPFSQKTLLLIIQAAEAMSFSGEDHIGLSQLMPASMSAATTSTADWY